MSLIEQCACGQIGSLKARIEALDVIAGANENTMRQWEGEAKRLRQQLERAVDLLDDMSDVLAEVTRGQLRPDSEAVRDVLRRATAHVNGQRSPVVTTVATT